MVSRPKRICNTLSGWAGRSLDDFDPEQSGKDERPHGRFRDVPLASAAKAVLRYCCRHRVCARPPSRNVTSVSFARSDPEAGKRGDDVVGISNVTETAADGTVLMDLHRLAEKRSIAYHRLIAERIRRDPTVLEGARARVRSWMSTSGAVPFYARKWHDILSRHVDAIAAFLIEDSELARELRQSTPFAGALSPAERWEIWRAVGATESMGRDTRRA